MTDEPKAAESIEPKASELACMLKLLAKKLSLHWIGGPEICTESADELLRLHAENESLRKDAERYQWLCRQEGQGAVRIHVLRPLCDEWLSMANGSTDNNCDLGMEKERK